MKYYVLLLTTGLGIVFNTRSFIPTSSILKNKSDVIQKEEVIVWFQPAKILKPSQLIDISDDQISDHWKLYEGYVKQTNDLLAELKYLRAQGQGASLAYADRRRRLGFEFNGMVLHELYFGNLKANQKINTKSELYQEIVKQFGSFDVWEKDFTQAGKTRGIGWVMLVRDNLTGVIFNLWVSDHEVNTLVDVTPLLVMDVWEHAYMIDHDAQGRSDYIQAFMKNINWPLIQRRFENAKNGLILSRVVKFT